MHVWTKEYRGLWQGGSLILTAVLCWWQTCQEDTVEASLPRAKKDRGENLWHQWNFACTQGERTWSKMIFLVFFYFLSPLYPFWLFFLLPALLRSSFLSSLHWSPLCLLFQKKIEMSRFTLFSGRNTIKNDDSGFDLTFSFFQDWLENCIFSLNVLSFLHNFILENMIMENDLYSNCSILLLAFTSILTLSFEPIIESW